MRAHRSRTRRRSRSRATRRGCGKPHATEICALSDFECTRSQRVIRKLNRTKFRFHWTLPDIGLNLPRSTVVAVCTPQYIGVRDKGDKRMSTTDGALRGYADQGPPGLLDKERTIAGSGFSRWLVPPAALAIHLCIGMAYGFSVFWLPLSKAIGIKESVACPAGTSFVGELFATNCDWRISTLGWMYTLFFVLLGSSAALWGGWLERVGPRKAGVVAAVCWCGGMLISAFGVYTHQLWLMILGSGVIGGIGLGLGYISPVSTLIKWFPDRRGMATGMAIMG